MNKQKLELLDIAADLYRSVYFYVESKNPKYNKCDLLQKVANNPNKFDFIDYNLIKNDNLPPREKAEYLLMFANQIQNKILYE
jgi:hypothetical protein